MHGLLKVYQEMDNLKNHYYIHNILFCILKVYVYIEQKLWIYHYKSCDMMNKLNFCISYFRIKWWQYYLPGIMCIETVSVFSSNNSH